MSDKIFSQKSYDFVKQNIKQFSSLIAFWRFYPDVMLDYIKPVTGGITLDADQRVYLRALVRTKGMYAIFNRGYGKTLIEVLGGFCVCLLYPQMAYAITAQTKENAAKILSEKVREVLSFYPIFKEDVVKIKESKTEAEVKFKNGSYLNILANNQTSKGQRRKRIAIEESVLIDQKTFEDALEPIVEVPRRTAGKLSLVDPREIHQQINFLSTAGKKGSSEHSRFLRMIDNMAENDGTYVLASDFKLSTWYGRGGTIQKMKQRFSEQPRSTFNMNYRSKWVGMAEGSIISFELLEASRVLDKPIVKKESGLESREFYIGVDVARSEKENNNKSSITVIEVKRNDKGRVERYEAPYLTSVPNTWSMTKQAIFIKKVHSLFNSRAIVIDGNGLGVGLLDEMVKEQRENGVIYPALNIMNEPSKNTEFPKADRKVYSMVANPALNSEMISNLIVLMENNALHLLKPVQEEDLVVLNEANLFNEFLPRTQTEELCDEIQNLKLVISPKTKVISVEQATKSINKDRFSSLIYVIWYIKTFAEDIEKMSGINLNKDLFNALVKSSSQKTQGYSPFGNRTERVPFGGAKSPFGHR